MLVSAQIEKQVRVIRLFAFVAFGDISALDECLEESIKKLIHELDNNIDAAEFDYRDRLIRMVDKYIVSNKTDRLNTQIWRALILIHVEKFEPYEARAVLSLSPEQLEKALACQIIDVS